MKPFFAIYKAKIAHELMRRGFELKKIAPNKNKSNFSVYYFEDTVELQRALAELIT